MATLLLAAGCGGDVIEAGPQAPPDGFVDVIIPVPPTTAATDGSTTPSAPSTGEPAAGRYDVGDCLTWEPGASEVVFEVVPCSDEHYVEVAGVGDLSIIFDEGEPFPEVEALTAAVGEVCGPVVERYLTDASTPEVEAGVIPPTEEAWAAGDRFAVCTVGLPRQDGLRQAYTGMIADGTAG